MNDLINELNRLDGVVKTLEDEAVRHEFAARECRTKRAEAKQQVAELRARLNDAKVVHAAQQSMAAADAAWQQTVAAKQEATNVLAALKEKERQLDELLSKAAEKAGGEQKATA